MANRTANYTAFYVKEPFSESNLGANATPDFCIIINFVHGKELIVLFLLWMLTQKHIMFGMIVRGKR